VFLTAARESLPGDNITKFLNLQDPGSRVLVIAPHPDDETIATAGVIVRAVKKGDAVKGVVIADGDHFIGAARLLTGRDRVTLFIRP